MIYGYEPGNEARTPKIEGVDWIDCYVDRPQNMPLKLEEGDYDVAIYGKDWEKQWGNKNIELVDLKGGGVELVVAIGSLPTLRRVRSLDDYLRLRHEEDREASITTEYIGDAIGILLDNEAYRELYTPKGREKPLLPLMPIEGEYESVGENEHVKIIRSYGQTEVALIQDGLIIESKQSGKQLREAGGRVIDPPIYRSTARLYAGQHVLQDDAKRDMVRRVARQIDGVIVGREYDDVKFNVPNEKVDEMIDYLERERLFSNEATIVPGRRYSQFNVLVHRTKWEGISDAIETVGGTYIARGPPRQVLAAEPRPRPYEIALGYAT